jgi:hypothetical protein
MEEIDLNDKPSGGFIPIIKKTNIKKHIPLEGVKRKSDIISIYDIMKTH